MMLIKQRKILVLGGACSPHCHTIAPVFLYQKSTDSAEGAPAAGYKLAPSAEHKPCAMPTAQGCFQSQCQPPLVPLCGAVLVLSGHELLLLLAFPNRNLREQDVCCVQLQKHLYLWVYNLKKSFCANVSLQRALSYTTIHQHRNINTKLRHKEPL